MKHIRSRTSILARASILPLLLAGAAQAQTVNPVALTLHNDQGLSLRAFQYSTGSVGAPRKAVVLMHGCAGVYSNSLPNDSYTNVQTIYRDWASKLANTGYVVLLVDSFSGRTDPATGLAVPQNQCGNGSAGVSEVNDRPLDALAAYHYLAGNATLNVDAQRVALVGWSHGASSVMATLAASQASRPFRAGLAFYPGCGLYNAFGGLSNSTYTPYAPFKILHADLDPLYTGGACQTRRDRSWILGGVQFQVIDHFAGAAHSFDGCKAVSGSCTSADVAAKTTADAVALNFLTDSLK